MINAEYIENMSEDDTGVETAGTTGKPHGSVFKNLSEGSRFRSGWLGGTAAASPQAYQKSHSAKGSTVSAVIYRIAEPS